jgi:hypothetical protein
VLDRTAPITRIDPLRRLLRQSIGEVHKHKDGLARAQASLNRALEYSAQLKARFASFDSVKEALAVERARIERIFAASGGAQREALPPDMVEQISECQQVAQDLEASGRAVDSLKTDCDKWDETVRSAERKVARAAAEIISQSAKQEAATLRTLKQRVAALEASLRGAARIWVPQTGPDNQPITQPITLGVEVHNALDMAPEQFAPSNNPENLAAAKWKTYFELLQTNPDALQELDS